MKLTINGREEERETTTLLELIKQLNIRPDIAIIELNKKLIARENYATTKVYQHDNLEIITLVGGG